MKTYNTNEEIKKDIVNGKLIIHDDVTFNCNVDINAYIYAYNIKAYNIDANNINAGDIEYLAVCFAHKNIKCKSIRGRRKNSKHFCLDGEIVIKKEENIIITTDSGDKISITKEKAKELGFNI